MKRIAVFFSCLTLALILLGVLVASSLPDGLERVARTLGFASLAGEGEAWSPFAGYQARFLDLPWPARAAAGLLGVILIYGFGVLLGGLVQRKGDS